MDEFKNCKTCFKPFVAARSDQKFCSLKCKNKQNNEKVKALYHQRKRENSFSSETNLDLIRNRDLLKANCDKLVTMKNLEDAGFKLNVITGFEQDDGKHPRLFCYDFGYQFVDKSTVKIFKR